MVCKTPIFSNILAFSSHFIVYYTFLTKNRKKYTVTEHSQTVNSNNMLACGSHIIAYLAVFECSLHMQNSYFQQYTRLQLSRHCLLYIFDQKKKKIYSDGTLADC